MKRKTAIAVSKILPRRLPEAFVSYYLDGEDPRRDLPHVWKTSKPFPKSRRKTTAARRAAKGKPCLMNVVGVCNHNPETTVLAHFRWLGECGTGIKPRDEQGAHACSECNRWTDSPTPKERDETYERDRNYYAARALVRMRLLDALDAF